MTYVPRETSPHPLGQHRTADLMEKTARLEVLHKAGVAVITVETDQGTKWRVDSKPSDPRPRPVPEWTDADAPVDSEIGLQEW
jgi:hypothetical protein